ncbi:MAG: CRTAC1 family protein [Acidobacteria bacterium]|nr:CRTAC1 family protein [Acidobacteriota bacterium]
MTDRRGITEQTKKMLDARCWMLGVHPSIQHLASSIFFICFVFSLAQQRNLPPTAQIPKPGVNAAPGVTFTEITKTAGLGNFQFISGSPTKEYIIEGAGAGCAFVDYDNDGWLDIYLVNGSTLDVLRGKAKAPRAALFRNNRDGTFTDVTEKAGVANERWGQGVCAGDFDNDGWADLYITNFGKNRFYRNNHNGTFTDITDKAGVALGGWSTGCAFGDYDADGKLDLFVAGYIDFDINNMPPAGSGEAPVAAGEGQEQGKDPGGMGASYTAGAKYCQYRGRRVMCGPRGLKGAPDYLFRNNGDGTFTDVSEKAGVADKVGYYGFGVAWVDYDDDGKLDLAVANDSTPSYLYRNKGDGTFEDVSYVSGTALNENGREQAGMGIAIGDYDGDGRIDIHRTNFSDDSNVLYHNDGEGNFSDLTFQMGLGEVTIPFLGWGTHFFDYDNDGPLDLLVANGHIYPFVDTADWGTTFKQRLLLFRNFKNRFFEVGSSAGAALYTLRSARGSSTGDFDNDGDLDILLNNMDDGPALLRNDGANKTGHWLTLRLAGDPAKKCPRDAIGTVVFCAANSRRMRDEVASGRSYNSQSDLRVHYGLGAATKVEKLEVLWANGKREEFVIEKVDQILTIEQGKGGRENTKQAK